tara:strand:+ start:2698 stop:3150 length:453 start_codon:yes stop_codon:yes gene_type:complete
MSHTLEIKIKSVDNNIKIPSYETNSSSGLDLRAYLPKGSILINSKETKLVGTGLFIEIPEGFEIQIRPRSGLAFKNGISVLNSPGTVDSDYRGEIKILLINHGNKSFKVEHEMRIAQMVVAKYERIQFKIVNKLSNSERGSDGFGSTGTQ